MKFAVREYQVATVVIETTQLVLSQFKQEAQLSQSDRATLLVTEYFAKSLSWRRLGFFFTCGCVGK